MSAKGRSETSTAAAAVGESGTRVLCVCGARPNFMKVAPLVEVLNRTAGVQTSLVHTGQHYDECMSRLFFQELGIPRPDVNLDVGSASHAVQTAEVMKRFEPICHRFRPHWVVVVGDVNSTLAAALTAAKLGVRVAHVEAGLRSFDRNMPEEINRILTDAISDLLFVSEPSGMENLRREGVAEGKAHLVGNVMIDTLLRMRRQAEQSVILADLGLQSRQYAVVTLHRPDNVDRPEAFAGVLSALERIAADVPVVFPMHPRSRHNLERFGLAARAYGISRLKVTEPLGYLDFLKLTAEAAAVLTDSGGIQEETTILNVPCLTLRDNTERPITITHGTNRLVGHEPEAVVRAFHEVRSHSRPPVRPPEGWDGRAAERIVAILLARR
ncbi:MAG: UDP-N-acetylglucosamine 2-epimerase (non-hydrolyzing) [Planctomycetes bacterium]|nr:UDP-N-acetylglucosamine 2-epimerase (non-hydrolyzing) [Planctomycetota bacterium]